jgi:hypothetical protein
MLRGMRKETMPLKSKEEHAAYMREYYKTRPEQLEAKRQRDRERYQEKREKILEYHREYYQENSTRIKEYAKTYGKNKRDELRIQAIEFAGGKCQDCNLEDFRVLQFHHRPGEIKVADVMTLHSSAKKFWAEVQKCDLVCANCHLIRHSDESGKR